MATEEVMTILCSILGCNYESELKSAALKCLSSMFSSPREAVIDKALSEGFLINLSHILKGSSNQEKELALFGLSNIAAGTVDQASAILNNQQLLELVLKLAMSSNIKVRNESLWVVCNLISSSLKDDLVSVIKLYEKTIGKLDIINPLCYNLTNLDKGELSLLLQMIKSIERLL